MVHLRHLQYQFLFVLIIFTSQASSEEEEEPAISVGAQVTAIPIGDTAEIECTASNNTEVFWYRGANATAEKRISQDDSLRVFANLTTGMLTVKDAMKNDTGEYLCQTTDEKHSVSAELHVYEMPTYFTEGMIIFGINVGLLVVFVGCALYTFIQKKRHTTATKSKETKANETNPQKVSTEL